jgi:CheY-like chemotaxis protein
VFEKTRVNLTELMQNICGGQKLTAQRKGLSFSLDLDSVLNEKIVFGDPTRITQIIFNLTSNAIKFTAKGNISVSVKYVEEKNNAITVNFSVKDTGIGIEKENLGVIFEPFTQESITTTRQYGGTGLGLAIVKRLLELQGLKMQVASTPNVGSEFSFNMRFPVSTENATELAGEMQQQTINQQEKLADIHLLIAEDNLINVMLMKKLLSKWGITPIIAENGERAVELVQDDNFDIILMDLQMPVMNGFDAAMHIRKMHDPKKANIPIIALTASALFDIRERVHNAGMNDYVSKPFKPVELFDKIKGLVAAVSIGSSIPVIPL